MKPRVYLETTVVSYLTAAPSRDLVIAAHQQLTREWWKKRDRFELFVSRAVLREAGGGRRGRCRASAGITGGGTGARDE